jgi:hypothetical protein
MTTWSKQALQTTIAIKLEPVLLTHPDADMRYALPDLLAERSGGVIEDDGYDYVGPSNAMVVFLKVNDLARATACIADVIANVRVLENDLRPAATVAIERGGKFEVIYPPDSREEFVL